jgi:type II secretory pathway pseudopilin PulG
MKRFKHPFTLVELLCVVIVIALLAAISVKATQIAYRRGDDTKTKTILEIIRVANEQYKAKNGYYYPCSDSSAISEGGETYYSLPLDPDFLGDAYETCRAMSEKNASVIVDAWGNAIRYRSPGKYNTSSFDMYSVGRDQKVGDADDATKQYAGLGDDIANFKNPKAK